MLYLLVHQIPAFFGIPLCKRLLRLVKGHHPQHLDLVLRQFGLAVLGPGKELRVLLDQIQLGQEVLGVVLHLNVPMHVLKGFGVQREDSTHELGPLVVGQRLRDLGDV